MTTLSSQSRFFLLFAIIWLFALQVNATVIITAPTGGQNISADKSVGGAAESFTNIGDIVITDQVAGDFVTGTTRRIRLDAPTNWRFEAGFGTVVASGANLSGASITVTATTITIIYTASGAAVAGNSLTISDIRVKSVSRTVGVAESITRINTTSQGTIAGFGNGAVVATLSKVPGNFSKLQVLLPGHIAAPGTTTGRTSAVATPQNAGASFEVTVNAVDDAFNIVTTAPNHEIQISGSANGVMPANNTLSGGSRTFNVTLNASGTNRTITATDISDVNIAAGISGGVTINAGVFTKLLLLLPGETADPGSATGKTGAPSNRLAGTAFAVTVIAVDANWNKVSVTDLVSVSSTDPIGVNPANLALSAGTRNFNITLKTIGALHTITATDVADNLITSYTTNPITVTPGSFTKLQILLPGEIASPFTTTGKTGTPSIQTAGMPFDVIVNAVDANWNIIADVTDEVNITNTNATYAASSILPANANLVAGTRTFSITLNRAVAQQLRVIDAGDVTKTAITSSSITVDPGDFTKLQILLPGETADPGSVTGKTGTPTDRTAGTSFNVTVNAVDDYWNKVTDVNDFVAITSNDVNDVMPSAYLSFGTRTNFAVTLKTAGTRILTATNLDNGGILADVSPTVTVNAGAFAKIQVLLPGETAAPGTVTGKTGAPLAQVAGVPFNVRVNAVDASWNLINTVTDEVKVTSNDVNAILPANNNLISGTQTFSVILKTAGSRSITVADFSDGTKTSNTSTTFSLIPGAYAKLQVLLPGETAAPGTVTGATGNPIIPARGTQFAIKIQPVDNFFNIVSGITNAVNLTTSDAAATINPVSTTLVSGGSRTVNVTIRTTNTQTITVTDAATTFNLVVNIPDQTILSAATDHFRSVNTGNWNDAASWESSADGVTNWHIATTTPTSTSASITVRNGNTITIIASVTVDDVNIENGGQVIVKTGTMTIADGVAATDFSVSGKLTNITGITANGALVFNTGGKYEHAFTTTTGIIPAATWNAGSVCEILGYTTYTGVVTGSGQAFSDFIWNCSDQNISNNGPSLAGTFSARNFTVNSTGSGVLNLASTGGTANISGNFNLINGIVSLNKTSGNAILNIAGNLSLNGVRLQQGNGAADIVFTGSLPQVYSKLATTTITGAINFTVNTNAVVDFGTSVIDGTSGNFTMLAGATLITANTNGFMASGTNSGTIQNTGARTYNIGNFTFNGNTAQLAGSGMPLTITNLIVSNPQGVTMPNGTATYNINGQLSINPALGYLDMGSNVLSGSFTDIGVGILKTQATSAFAAGRTWNVGVEYTSSTNQNIISGTYNTLLATSGAGVKSGPSSALNIAGNWSSSGGRIDFISNNTPVNFNGLNQNISDLGSNGGNGVIFRNINFSGGNKTLMSGNFSVAEDGILTMSASSTLNANGHLTLLSNANSSATVAAIPSTSSIRGQVKVQQFVSGGPQNPFRTYRMFSSPVYDNTTAFINTDGYGNRSYNFNQFIDDMIISGTNGAANGFDVTPGNGATAFTYNNGYIAIPNITTTVNVAKGAYIFYRGNRDNFNRKITSPFADPEDNIIDFDGVLNQQNITVPLTYNAATNGYNLIGNPYASSIDWDSPNWIKSSSIDHTIRIWNPAIRQYATYDGFASVNGGSRYIAAGQSFFIQTSAPGSITFTENVKVNSQPQILLLNAPKSQVQTANTIAEKNAVVNDVTSSSVIKVTLKKDQTINQDETVIVLNNTKSDMFVQGEDVKHLKGEQVFLSSLSTDKTALVINYMPSIDRVSSVDLNVDATATTGDYHLDFELNNIPTNYIIQLKDKYLNTVTNLSSGSSYALSIDKNNTASFGADRFSIIMVAPVTLPVKLTSFTATKVNQGVEVKWVTATEDKNNRFEVERAGDDKAFTKISTVLAKGPSSYVVIDKNPLIGNNYYRLKQFDNDDKIEEFGPITIRFDANIVNANPSLSIYPNPVSDQFTVKYNGVLSAKQQLKLINPMGKVIFSKTITKEELNNGYKINTSSYPTGIYLLEVTNEGDNSKVGLLKVIKL